MPNMPCDGKNPSCERRRELLAQLKCLVSSMDRKKPCEWDEPPCPPPNRCPVVSPCEPCCRPLKECKSFDLRASLIYRCECIKRNGLQDRCMMFDCMGRPECMTKLYPVCRPGRSTLLKLTDLGDAEVALRKFHCADQAREAALAAYCRLACSDGTRSCSIEPPTSPFTSPQSSPSAPPCQTCVPFSSASSNSRPCLTTRPSPCVPYVICQAPCHRPCPPARQPAALDRATCPQATRPHAQPPIEPMSRTCPSIALNSSSAYPHPCPPYLAAVPCCLSACA